MKALCHCLTCRKLTGSAYATAFLIPDPDYDSDSPASTAPTPTAHKKSGSGEFKLHSLTNTPAKQTEATHETGLAMTFHSCAKCPSTLYKTAKDGFPGLLVVFAGCLDAEQEDGGGGETTRRAQGGLEGWGTPQAELFVKYRLPWVKEVEGAKQCEEFL